MALAGAIAGAPNFWVYRTADTAATVDTSGYFTNGYDLGMRDGDLLFLYVTGTKVWTTHTITVSGTTVNVADGTTVGSGTNTD
jgi:hypothetical protein